MEHGVSRLRVTLYLFLIDAGSNVAIQDKNRKAHLTSYRQTAGYRMVFA